MSNVDWNYALNLQVCLLLPWKKLRTVSQTEKLPDCVTATLSQVVLTADSSHIEE